MRLVVGFTLVELLVVIAIIAILASLLLTTLARAKNAGQRAACQNNLRQIALGLSMYAAETGVYPHGMLWHAKAPFASFWAIPLRPYVGSSWTGPVYLCPSYKGPTDDSTSLATATTFPVPYGSYGYNFDGSGRSQNSIPAYLGLGPALAFNDPFKAIKEAQVVAPSEMIAFADEIKLPTYLLFVRGAETNHDRNVHPGGYNIGFVDNHVQFTKTPAFLGSTEVARRRWNNDNQPHPETW